MSEPQSVTLSNLAEGAAEELFGAAFRQVLENIDDPNTDWKKPRRITLSITVYTDELRKNGEIEVAVNTKLPGVKPVNTRIFMGRHLGKLAAVEALHQEEMFPQPKGRPASVVASGEKA